MADDESDLQTCCLKPYVNMLISPAESDLQACCLKSYVNMLNSPAESDS